jgi:hypothetical protein
VSRACGPLCQAAPHLGARYSGHASGSPGRVVSFAICVPLLFWRVRVLCSVNWRAWPVGKGLRSSRQVRSSGVQRRGVRRSAGAAQARQVLRSWIVGSSWATPVASGVASQSRVWSASSLSSASRACRLSSVVVASWTTSPTSCVATRSSGPPASNLSSTSRACRLSSVVMASRMSPPASSAASRASVSRASLALAFPCRRGAVIVTDHVHREHVRCSAVRVHRGRRRPMSRRRRRGDWLRRTMPRPGGSAGRASTSGWRSSVPRQRPVRMRLSTLA